MGTTYEVFEYDGEEMQRVAESTKHPDYETEGNGVYLVVPDENPTWMYPVNSPTVAVLSSPLTFGDGLFKSVEVDFPQTLAGLPHYVGHPATRALLEALGAEYTPGRWTGPKVGESYLAVPLAQNTREGGWTADTAIEDVEQLCAILITRIA